MSELRPHVCVCSLQLKVSCVRIDSAHTARNLYHNCLTSDRLMRGRTRILVTHALHLTIPLADYMVALSNGYVAFDGPAEDYIVASGANTPGLATGQNFASLVLKRQASVSEAPISVDDVADAAAEQLHEHLFPHLGEQQPLAEENLLTHANAEKQSTGAVTWSVYTFYARAFASPAILALLIAVIVMTESAAVGSNWALRLWASSFDYIARVARSSGAATLRGISASTLPGSGEVSHEPDYYLRTYVGALFLYGIRVRKCDRAAQPA